MEKLIKESDAIKELAEYLMTDAQIEWSGTASEDIEDWKELAEQILNNIPAVEPWELYNPDEWCKDCKEYDTENHRCPRWNKVIRKTLEEVPAVEPCKDAISREWMLNELEEMNVANFYEANFHSNEVYGDMKQMIKDAPPVTVEPKQGEWIEHKWKESFDEYLSPMPMHIYECPYCHYRLRGFERTNFCPNCGARMEGADDETN